MTNPPISDLVDDFSEGFDASLWSASGSPMPLWQNNRIEIVLPEGFDRPSSTVTAIRAYDLTGAAFFLELSMSGDLETPQAHEVVLSDGSNSTIVTVDSGGPSVSSSWTNSGGGSGGSAPASIDITKPLWVRVREQSGVLYWDYGTNGQTWTGLDSVALGAGASNFNLDATNVTPSFEMSNSGISLHACTFAFDNVNISPGTTSGSWWQLLDIQKHAQQEFEFWANREPMACPNDGEPLHRAPPSQAGAGAILYCPFDGWQYPRDWVRPEPL